MILSSPPDETPAKAEETWPRLCLGRLSRLDCLSIRFMSRPPAWRDLPRPHCPKALENFNLVNFNLVSWKARLPHHWLTAEALITVTWRPIMKPFAPLILVAFVLAANCTTVFSKSREFDGDIPFKVRPK